MPLKRPLEESYGFDTGEEGDDDQECPKKLTRQKQGRHAKKYARTEKHLTSQFTAASIITDDCKQGRIDAQVFALNEKK